MNFAIAVTNKSAKVYKDAPKNKPMKPPTSAYKLSSSYNHNLRIGSSQIRGFENLSFNNLLIVILYLKYNYTNSNGKSNCKF